MSKVLDIREVCGDYALDVEYSADYTFTMFFNSRRNAETVKRCIEVDDSVPNVATAVDFVEVVRCRDCRYHLELKDGGVQCDRIDGLLMVMPNDYCSKGERKDKNEG
jgi:hypothetical protein